MYKHYEASEDVFVDREEYIEWMDKALVDCKKKSKILHLKGIGGIGKSSLIRYWNNNVDSAVRLDCEQFSDFYFRLDRLAKGLVRIGVKLPRFDILWHIRKRFVEGVEPAKESGREWAKEVLIAIPFIGSLASIGSAISAVGKQVAPKLKGKYGPVGKWLQECLGSDYIEKLLEILWKDPRHAEFLYLDALLEDINDRKDKEKPLLFLLDHFEYVDQEEPKWRYGGRKISEAELWYIFLSSLSNTVSAVGSRRVAPVQVVKEPILEEKELIELDRYSCVELLELQGVNDEKLQNMIISVSGGNPFVIDAICDILVSRAMSNGDIEDLRADTLEEVRLKTWRKLFSEVKDLMGLVDRAGLLPFFDRRIMDIIAPDMKTDQWERFVRLSFVVDRGDGYFVLHDLAEELVRSELGNRLEFLTKEVAELLEKTSVEESAFKLLALSISARAVASPSEAALKLGIEYIKVGNRPVVKQMVEAFEYIKKDSEEVWFEVQCDKCMILFFLRRHAECEDLALTGIERARMLVAEGADQYQKYLARLLHPLSIVLSRTGRRNDAEPVFKETLEIFRRVYESEKKKRRLVDFPTYVWFWNALRYYVYFLWDTRLEEARELLSESLKLTEDAEKYPTEYYGEFFTKDVFRSDTISNYARISMSLGRVHEAEEALTEAVEGHTDPYMKSWNQSDLANLLIQLDRFNEAREVLNESMNTIKGLFETEPEFSDFRVVYKWTLNLQGHLFIRSQQFGKAEKALLESLEIAREYATDDRGKLEVASCLSSLGKLHRIQNRYSEAEDAYKEALLIFQDYRKKTPDFSEYNLRNGLNNMAIILTHNGRLDIAEKYYLEALDYARVCSAKIPEDVYESNRVGAILTNLGILFRHADKHFESERVFEESIEIRRRQVEESPELFLSQLAFALVNYGVLLYEMKTPSQSREVLSEALEILRELRTKNEIYYTPWIARALNNLGIAQKKEGEHDKADSSFHEALEIWEEYYTKSTEVYERELIMTLTNLYNLLSEIGEQVSIDIIAERLQKLGVKEPASEEQWSEVEIDL